MQGKQAERELDDKNFAAIRYQMLAECNFNKSWFVPRLPSALGNLGMIYQRQKQPEKEREILRQMIVVDAAVCPIFVSTPANRESVGPVSWWFHARIRLRMCDLWRVERQSMRRHARGPPC